MAGMKPWQGALLAVFLLAAMLGLGYWLKPKSQPVGQAATCPDLSLACRLVLDGQPVLLRAEPKPAPLHPFRLLLRGYGKPLTVRFGMRGMDMGPIAYPFKTQTDGTQMAEVMLPFCVQGRSDWWLRLEADGATAVVAFSAHR
jgi:hypothetical protein